MMKKFRTFWLAILAVGIVLFASLMKSGRENGLMSDLVLCFIFEATIVFIFVFMVIMEERSLNHKFFNGLLLLSFLVAGFMAIVGFSENVFCFVSVNLVIYIFYLFFRNKLIKIELRRTQRALIANQLILQNYRTRHARRIS